MMNEGITKVDITIVIIIYLITALISRLSMALLLNLLREAGCKSINYRGKEVVLGAGMAFVPILMLTSVLCMFFYSKQLLIYVSYSIGVCAVGFAGILDDLLGEKHIKGLKNHFSSFICGHLTTGFIKALIGIVAAITMAINISKDIFELLLNILNIALFTNTLNLMDLRPGRCTKSFILIGVLIYIVNIKRVVPYIPLGIALIMASVYLLFDLKEQCMLGDTGSNILGITVGYFFSINSTTLLKLIVFITLLLLNIAAEKVSFTAIISKNKFLNYLDSIGRSSL